MVLVDYWSLEITLSICDMERYSRVRSVFTTSSLRKRVVFVDTDSLDPEDDQDKKFVVNKAS